MISKKEIDEFRDWLTKNNYPFVGQTIKQFHEDTNLSRATFFRRRRILRGLQPYNNKQYRIDKTKCYFCQTKENLIIHHKNKDREDNRATNLIVLCYNCHSRLHNLLL